MTTKTAPRTVTVADVQPGTQVYFKATLNSVAFVGTVASVTETTFRQGRSKTSPLMHRVEVVNVITTSDRCAPSFGKSAPRSTDMQADSPRRHMLMLPTDTLTVHGFIDVDADTAEVCTCGATFAEGRGLQHVKRAHMAALVLA